MYNNCCNHLIHELFRFACEIPYKKRELCLYLIFTPDRLISRVELSSLSPYSLLFTHNSAENFQSQHFSSLKHTGIQCTTELQLGKTKMNKLLRFILFSHLLLSCLWPRQSTISLADDNMVDPVTRSIKIVKKT